MFLVAVLMLVACGNDLATQKKRDDMRARESQGQQGLSNEVKKNSDR